MSFLHIIFILAAFQEYSLKSRRQWVQLETAETQIVQVAIKPKQKQEKKSDSILKKIAIVWMAKKRKKKKNNFPLCPFFLLK